MTQEAYTWTPRGNNNFRITCESQDSNSRKPGLKLKILALIPCQASCTSQRNQKCILMERASTIHLYTSIALTCIFDICGGQLGFFLHAHHDSMLMQILRGLVAVPLFTTSTFFQVFPTHIIDNTLSIFWVWLLQKNTL
jgi:hypothetical protein